MRPRLLTEWKEPSAPVPLLSLVTHFPMYVVHVQYFSHRNRVAFHIILPAWVLTLNLPTPTHPPTILPPKGLRGPGCSHCKSACAHWSNLYRSRGSRKLKTWLSHKCVVWASIIGLYITLIRSSARLRLTETKKKKWEECWLLQNWLMSFWPMKWKLPGFSCLVNRIACILSVFCKLAFNCTEWGQLSKANSKSSQIAPLGWESAKGQALCILAWLWLSQWHHSASGAPKLSQTAHEWLCSISLYLHHSGLHWPCSTQSSEP